MRGGAGYQVGPPASVKYSLADGWSSKASLGQGEDYFKYHADQHGGAALGGAEYPLALADKHLLSGDTAASARVNGLDAAITYSAQFKDDYPKAMVPHHRIPLPGTTQRGGRRRRSVKNNKKNGKNSKKSKKSRRPRRRQGGGMHPLEFASVKAPGLLLPNKTMYDNAGLNPEFRGAAAEYWSADQRDAV